MMRPVRALLRSGIAVALAGALVMAVTIGAYVERARLYESTAGLVVFRNGYVSVEGKSPTMVQSIPFDLGVEPTVMLCGIALIVAAFALAATTWRPSAPRGRNAS